MQILLLLIMIIKVKSVLYLLEMLGRKYNPTCLKRPLKGNMVFYDGLIYMYMNKHCSTKSEWSVRVRDKGII